MIYLKKLVLCMVLIILSFGSALTANAQLESFNPNLSAEACTKARVSQAGKYATWSCTGEGKASLSFALSNDRSLIKTKVNSKAGEVRYTQKTPEQKVSFAYNRGILSYSGYVSGNGFIKNNGLRINKDGDFVLDMDYKMEDRYVVNGDICDLKKVEAKYYNQGVNQIYGRVVSGKTRISLSADRINGFKKTPPHILSDIHYKYDTKIENLIKACNDYIENLVKSNEFTLRGFYSKDIGKSNAFAEIAGYQIPVSLFKIEGSLKDKWLSQSSTFAEGDEYEIQGRFHFVDVANQIPNPDIPCRWLTCRELRLSDIVDFRKVMDTQSDKVNLSGVVLWDNNNERIYNKFYSNLTDEDHNLETIKLVATSQTNQKYYTSVDKSGNYTFADLPNGIYNIRIDFENMKAYFSGDISYSYFAQLYTLNGLSTNNSIEVNLKGSNRNVKINDLFVFTPSK